MRVQTLPCRAPGAEIAQPARCVRSRSADGPAVHGFGQSGTLTIPANSVLIFAVDS
jgi:hypothetical protein